MHVTIVGAGIGGLTLALALAQAGCSSTVVEQAEAVGEVGAGLQLSPNAMKALRHLGLEDKIAAIGCQPEAVEVRDHASERLLLRSELGDAAVERWGAPYVQAHRADLHGVLTQAISASGLVDLQLGRRAELKNGVLMVNDQARSFGDLIVGADGLRSKIREQVAGPGAPRFTGQVAWRGLVPVERLGVAPHSPLARVWTGPRAHFVHYPVRGGALVNFIAVTAQADWTVESWSEPGSKAALSSAFEGWPSVVQTLIGAADPLMRWALYDRSPLAGWSRGATTLLGDAAHPMTPFLAQGAGMAIEDGLVLARCLASAGPVSEALQRYEAARRARTTKVQAWSRRNGLLFHLPGSIAAGVFGAAHWLEGVSAKSPQARFDWLYAYDPATASF